MINLTLLTDVVKHLYKLKNSTVHINESDGIARMLWGIRDHFNSFTFSITGPKPTQFKTYIEYNIYELKYSRMSYTESGICFGDQCVIEVCFSTSSYYANVINHHDCILQFNNDFDEAVAVSINKDRDFIFLKEQHFEESWLFQLQTLHDIPFYEDMLVLKGINNFLHAQGIDMSFKIRYNPEYVNDFLEKILEHFNAEVGTNST